MSGLFLLQSGLPGKLHVDLSGDIYTRLTKLVQDPACFQHPVTWDESVFAWSTPPHPAINSDPDPDRYQDLLVHLGLVEPEED